MSVKREGIRHYFTPKPKIVWGALIVGVIILLIGLAAGSAAMIIVGLLVTGAMITHYGIKMSNYNRRPSDAQMDVWIEEDLKSLDQKALAKTGTDATELVSESVMVTGPRFWNVSNAAIGYKRGDDNIIRFSPMNVTILNFTADQLVAYSCALDLMTGNALNESTDEYFYRDVVAVSTKTRSLNVQVGGRLMQLNSAETFELTTSGGTSIEVLLRDPSLTQFMSGNNEALGDVPTTRAEKAIQTVRKMVREKKSGTA